MSDTFDKARDAAEGVMRRTEETVQEVTKRAGRAATKARDRASGMMDDVDPHAARVGLERWTRARPLVALLVAGTVGAIIGRALLPRRS